jgi:5'-nucleotidase
VPQVIAETKLGKLFMVTDKPVLIIDMDGVTCQFVPAVCAEHNRLTGDNLKPEDITDWNMKLFGIQNETWLKPGFFRNLEPMPGAAEILYLIRKDFRLSIATDCQGVDFVQADKRAWLEEYLPFVDDIYFLADKSAVPGHLIFDDAPHHLEAFPGITVKINTKYNVDAAADHEVDNWRQFYNLLQTIAF